MVGIKLLSCNPHNILRYVFNSQNIKRMYLLHNIHVINFCIPKLNFLFGRVQGIFFDLLRKRERIFLKNIQEKWGKVFEGFGL